jgi:hypothetical protein
LETGDHIWSQWLRIGYGFWIRLYAQGKLGIDKARELAGMSLWEFQQLLAERKISFHYDVQEFEEDLQLLSDLGRIGLPSAPNLV